MWWYGNVDGEGAMKWIVEMDGGAGDVRRRSGGMALVELVACPTPAWLWQRPKVEKEGRKREIYQAQSDPSST